MQERKRLPPIHLHANPANFSFSGWHYEGNHEERQPARPWWSRLLDRLPFLRCPVSAEEARWRERQRERDRLHRLQGLEAAADAELQLADPEFAAELRGR